MNILLYFVSKNYRRKIQEAYTRSLEHTMDLNYCTLEQIYKDALQSTSSKAA